MTAGFRGCEPRGHPFSPSPWSRNPASSGDAAVSWGQSWWAEQGGTQTTPLHPKTPRERDRDPLGRAQSSSRVQVSLFRHSRAADGDEKATPVLSKGWEMETASQKKTSYTRAGVLLEGREGRGRCIHPHVCPRVRPHVPPGLEAAGNGAGAAGRSVLGHGKAEVALLPPGMGEAWSPTGSGGRPRGAWVFETAFPVPSGHPLGASGPAPAPAGPSQAGCPAPRPGSFLGWYKNQRDLGTRRHPDPSSSARGGFLVLTW